MCTPSRGSCSAVNFLFLKKINFFPCFFQKRLDKHNQKQYNKQVRKKYNFAALAQLDRVFGYEPKGQGFESLTPRQQKTHFCLPTKVRFLNDVCLWQMMLAVPMMTATPNDVCLTAHKGKHRIIATRCGATSYFRSECIISPQAMHHLTNENLRANSNRGLLVKVDRLW